jgi:hypothetical protein
VENNSYRVVKEGLEKKGQEKRLVLLIKMLNKIVKNKNINTRLAYIDLIKQILTKIPEDRIPEVQITILTNCYNLMNTSTDIVKLQIIKMCRWVIEFLCNETK